MLFLLTNILIIYNLISTYTRTPLSFFQKKKYYVLDGKQ